MWLYQGRELTEAEIVLNAGFVYIIHDNANGCKYVGQKRFRSQRTLPPLKGSKRKRKIVSESSWRDYMGSNAELLKIVEANDDPARFRREILHLAKTAAHLNYLETYEIFTRHALISSDYYNSFVTCRINSSHVKALKKV